MRLAAFVCTVTILLGGCLEGDGFSDNSSPVLNAGNLWDFDAPVNMTGTPLPLDSNETWSRLEIRASGGPGTWLVVHRELAEPTSEIAYDVNYKVESEGNGDHELGLFIIPPQIVLGSAGPPGQVYLQEAELFFDPEKTNIAVQKEYEKEWIWHGSPIYGFISVVGSTGKWAANIALSLNETANTTGPSFSSAGKNVTAAFPGERFADLENGPAGSVSLEKKVHEPGLAHFEILANSLLEDPPLYPYVRNCSFVLDWWAGNCTDWGIGARETNTAFGAFTGPGDALFHATYVETSSDFSLGFIHLPDNGTMFPEDLIFMAYSIRQDPAQSNADISSIEKANLSRADSFNWR